jgi:steroid delta-isomerase-like uncharacterized protein
MLPSLAPDTLRRTWQATWNQGRLEALDNLLAPDYAPHHSLNPVLGPEGVKQLVAGFQSALPDLEFEIEDLIDAGEKLVVRWSLSGTHQAELFGLAATGRRIKLTGISIYRLAAGQVVESWDELDLFSLLDQVGVFGRAD